jgi:hypothetical protein
MILCLRKGKIRENNQIRSVFFMLSSENVLEVKIFFRRHNCHRHVGRRKPSYYFQILFLNYPKQDFILFFSILVRTRPVVYEYAKKVKNLLF